jgi:uncharacterized protein involved in exopolysaccharide biosynthesis
LKHWSNTLKENEIQSAILADGRSLDLRAIERLCMARWRFILTISFLCALTAGAVSFLIPNRYTATASILPTGQWRRFKRPVIVSRKYPRA